MSSVFSTLFDAMAAPVLEEQLGEDATYTPPGGSPAAITVIFEEESREGGGNVARDEYDEQTTRRGVVCAPAATTYAEGGTFSIRGETWQFDGFVGRNETWTYVKVKIPGHRRATRARRSIGGR